jgi:hypothetical protein
MTMPQFKNFVGTTLQTGCAAGDTVLFVNSTDATKFAGLIAVPGDWAVASIFRKGDSGYLYEFVKITGVNGNELTVVRGLEGTAAKTWNAGDSLELRMTASILQAMMDQEWIRPKLDDGSIAPATFIDTTHCTITGNHVGICTARRACMAIQTSTGAGYIVGAAYDGGTNKTTVEVEGVVLDAGLVVLDLGAGVLAAPKYPHAATADVAAALVAVYRNELIAEARDGLSAEGHGHNLSDISDAGSAAALDTGDAPEDVATNEKVDAKIAAQATTVHPPQSIVKAALGARPAGWSPADCDAPVESMTASGTIVTVPAGLQVAYADNWQVRLSAELASPIAVDLSAEADGTKYIYVDLDAGGAIVSAGVTDIPPEAGVSAGGSDVMPVFSGATLAGWGTVSATSEFNATNAPWKALDGTIGTAYLSASGSFNGGVGNQTWKTNFTKPRSFPGVFLRSNTAVGDAITAPRDFNVLCDGVIVATFTGVTWAVNEEKYFGFDTPARNVSELSIQVLAIANTISTGYVSMQDVRIPLFDDMYNPVTITMLNSADTAIRRVYLGSVVKSGSSITAVHCYALGTSAVIPVNNGTNVTTNATYYNTLAFPGNQSAELEIKYKGLWFQPPVIASAGYGAKAHALSDKIESVTGSARILDGALSKNILMTPVATDAIVSSVPARIIARRGY